MRKIYELSYWLRKEGNIEKLQKIFKEMNLEVIKEIPAKERTPAYPINKETLALFGTFYFYAKPEEVEDLKRRVQSLSDVLRFIILKRKYIKELNNSQIQSNIQVSNQATVNESQ